MMSCSIVCRMLLRLCGSLARPRIFISIARFGLQVRNDAQRVLSKALCGFANADGGVLVIGLEAKSGPGKDDPDLIQQTRPVPDAMAVKSRIENLVGQLVEPGLQGVRLAAVPESPSSSSGFVLVNVPPNRRLPVPFP